MYRYIIIGLCWLCILPVWGDAQSIPPQRRTDWSNPGAENVFTPSRTVDLSLFDADPTGFIPADMALEKAIQSLEGPGMVLFPAGRYRFDAPIHLPDSIILRGTSGIGNDSPQATLLLHSGDDHGIIGKGAITELGPIHRGDLLQGQTYVGIRPDHPFQDGDLLWIRPVDDGPLLYNNWALQSTGQFIRIQEATPTRLWLEKPLRRTFITNNITLVQVHPRRQVHLECLAIERLDTTEAQSANIYFDYALDCSVTGIHSQYGNFSHITIQRSAHISIENSVFTKSHDYGNGGRGYGVMLQFSASDCYIHQNNFATLRHAMILQAGANGNVLAYNHSIDPFWTGVSLPEDASGDLVLHGNYVYQNLMEGNVVQNIVIDVSHGVNGPNNTFFRNRAEGYGLFIFEGATLGGQNLIGNQVTNTSSLFHGQFFLNQSNHLVWNNWIRDGAGDSEAIDHPAASLFNYNFGSYYEHIGAIPAIQHAFVYSNMPPIEAQYRMIQHQPATCGEVDYSMVVSTHEENGSFSSKLNIYPNPFVDQLQIDGLNPDTPVGLYDLQGRLLETKRLSNQDIWALPHLSAGMYIIRMQHMTVPVVKVH